MLIVLSGLPGTGKTTLARALALQLRAVHVQVDAIEGALRDAGLPDGKAGFWDAGYRAACAVAEDNLRLGLIVVADSVNPVAASRDAWLTVANRAQVPIVEVEVECSDRAEHQRRVEDRFGALPGLIGPTWQEVESREYMPWSRDHVIVDTASRTAAESVARLRAAIGAWQP